MGKNISKNLSGKYSQKLLDHAKKSATVSIKTASQKAIRKAAEAKGDLISNKIAYKITKVSKSSAQNNLEPKNIEDVIKTLKERHISLEKRQQIIDNLRLLF